LVVTADHAILLGSAIRKLFADDSDYAPTVYDRIPLLIRSPIHELPTTVSQVASGVDLVPTLLHLVELNEANAFMGMSLLDPRRRRRGLFGSQARESFVLEEGDERPQVFNTASANSNDPGAAALYRRWFQ
jgi:arylsulfatase A-like enzyme